MRIRKGTYVVTGDIGGTNARLSVWHTTGSSHEEVFREVRPRQAAGNLIGCACAVAYCTPPVNPTHPLPRPTPPPPRLTPRASSHNLRTPWTPFWRAMSCAPSSHRCAPGQRCPGRASTMHAHTSPGQSQAPCFTHVYVGCGAGCCGRGGEQPLPHDQHQLGHRRRPAAAALQLQVSRAAGLGSRVHCMPCVGLTL